MNTVRGAPATQAHCADILAWLRMRVGPDAQLHADTRSLRAGDIFAAYAVNGADSRPFIAAALEQGAVVLYQPEDGIEHLDPDVALAVPALNEWIGEIASEWYGRPSDAMRMIGVTGTNGKTSCAHWIATAFTALHQPCALIGTLGAGMLGQLVPTGFTTPDAAQLQRSLARLHIAGAEAVAMEVSSHALHQGRVSGTRFDIAVFTNLTQDHLDYHRTFDAYEAAKARLFAWPGLQTAIINRDDLAGQRLLRTLSGRMPTIAYGIEAFDEDQLATQTVIASQVRATVTGTAFQLLSSWGNADIEVKTLGLFNVSNMLAVLSTLFAAGIPFAAACDELTRLEPVKGRMQQLGGSLQNHEPLVVVDYAHTPDALEKTLDALRPIATVRGGALICLFGCGGDRDAAKRRLMGAIAERLADHVVVTSDNPRSEDPQKIMAQIVSGMRSVTKARCFEDRGNAILRAVCDAEPADVIVLAGKGHETTQEIKGKKREFSDQDHAQAALVARLRGSDA